MRTTFATRLLCCLLCLGLLGGSFSALADGARPAGGGIVHWRLQEIMVEEASFTKGGYTGQSNYVWGKAGVKDRLDYTIEGKDGLVLSQRFTWDAFPEALVQDTTYPLIFNLEPQEVASRFTSSFILSVAGTRAFRIREAQDSVEQVLELAAPSKWDETFVVQVTLQDSMGWGKTTIRYTYERFDGPVPAAAPVTVEFSALEPDHVPGHYVAVPGLVGLYELLGSSPRVYRQFGAFGTATPGYYPADAMGNLLSDEAVNPAMEAPTEEPGFEFLQPEDLPAHYVEIMPGLYAFETLDGTIHYRVYGAFPDTAPGYYPADALGNPLERSPVDPTEDEPKAIEGFTPLIPASTGAYGRQEQVSLWSFVDRDGVTHYRAYGSLNGGAPGYYPADAQGNVALDAQPVDPQTDFDTYIKGFVVLAPQVPVPSFYEPMIITESHFGWRFEGRDGSWQYRVYGRLNGQAAAFYPADDQGNLLEGAAQVLPAQDYIEHIKGFVPMAYTPSAYDFYEEVPGSDGSLWRFQDAEDVWQYRAYGSLHRGAPAFYPADENGLVLDDATPIARDRDRSALPTPTPVVFTPDEPEEVPYYYDPVEGAEGLWQVRSAEPPEYRMYGQWSGQEKGFYPADAQGNALPGAQPVDPEMDFVQYVKGFVAVEPPAELIPYYYQREGEGPFYFLDEEGNAHYRVYGSMDTQDPAFYPADAEGQVAEDAQAIDNVQEFAQYIQGFRPMVPDEGTVPDFYTPVTQDSGEQATLWQFEDTDGVMHYRVYGAVDLLEPGFYEADAQGQVDIGTPVVPAIDQAMVNGAAKPVSVDPTAEATQALATNAANATSTASQSAKPTQAEATQAATPEATVIIQSTPEVTATVQSTLEATATAQSTPEATATVQSTPEATATAQSTLEATATVQSTPETTATAEATPEATATATEAATATADPTAEPDEPTPVEKNSTPVWVWIVGGVVLLNLVGLAVYWIRKKRKS